MGDRSLFYEKRPGVLTKRIDVFLLKWYGKKKLFLKLKGGIEKRETAVNIKGNIFFPR